MHYNCYIACGKVPNVSLLAGYILYQSPYPDLKPLKTKIAKRCTSGFLFFPSFYFYLPHSLFSLFVFFVIVNIFFVIFSFLLQMM